MQFWLYRGFGSVASQSAGASSYSFWFYGGMQSQVSDSQGSFYFQFLTTD